MYRSEIEKENTLSCLMALCIMNRQLMKQIFLNQIQIEKNTTLVIQHNIT